MKVNRKIELLRNEMRKRGLDAYVIPSNDPHQSEYVCDYFKSREFISGFTGSAGAVVITMDKNGLWTDGRYYIQAEKQLEGSSIDLFKMREPDVPTINEWLFDNLQSGNVVGFDSKVFSQHQVNVMKRMFSEKNIDINGKYDLIDLIWENRPDLSKEKAMILDVKYAGKSALEKLNEVRKEMNKKDASYYILSSLDDIAWTFNIRGNDIECSPVVISYSIIEKEKATLFIDQAKLSEEIKDEFEKQNIYIRDYEDISTYISSFKSRSKVLIDINRNNSYIYNSISNKCKIIKIDEITNKLKAIKNEVEIKNLKKCHDKDNVAMVKFLYWLKNNIGKEKITEISASDRLENYRKRVDLFQGLSFNTIAAYKDHAAMMHYSAKKETEYELQSEGFYLLDSGGQYLDGTTDITRTIVLGELTYEQKRDYTLTLKGHIALAKFKFLKGITGTNLDVLARQFLWQVGIDYKCGTGHGVGFFLNVHEGPQGFTPYASKAQLEKGMIITNEPGVYKAGKYGIRIENTILVVEDEKTEFGQFMKFETISYCPFDLNGIIVDLLTEEEKDWLNTYHQMVYKKTSSHLTDEERNWLKNETRSI